MSYNKVAVIIVVALLLITGRSYGFNMLTHLWLGEHTLNIWESYDPEFSMAVSEDDDNETRRMYRIGLMLPDLLDPSAQNAIREVIDTIYEKLDIDERFGFDLRDNGIGVSGSASVYLDARSALWISSNVYQSVQEPITFNGNYPNENMQKLWQMVDYIHNTNAPPSHKALIYGGIHACITRYVCPYGITTITFGLSLRNIERHSIYET